MNRSKGIAGSLSLALLLSSAALGQQYKQTNLVADTSGVAAKTDSALVNPWGLARSSGGAWWVADAGTGLSTLYNGAGAKQGLVVTIPKADPKNSAIPHGLPAGVIFNGSPTDFLLAPGKQAVFIFSTLDGGIAAWNPGFAISPGAAAPSTNAVTVAHSAGSAYTGLTAAQVSGETFLYAANFAKGRIDIFDNGFRAVRPMQLVQREERHHGEDADDDFRGGQKQPFTDDRLPQNYAPFNVQAIGTDLVVTYALTNPNSPAEIAGPGLGYVDIFSTNGKLLRRLEHGVWLNAPWGVALAPTDFGRFSHDLLIGQFGGAGTSESAGVIAAYDLTTGRFDGLLQDAAGKPIVIPGLWALSPGNVAPNNLDPAASPAAQIYFSAGTNNEQGGLYGYLSAVPSTLIQGNDQ